MKHFYVDDLLRSKPDVATAIHRIKDLSALLDDSGFHLTKFISNRAEVIQSVPEEERSPAHVHIATNDLVTCKTLGLQWDVLEDAYRFEIDIQKGPYTKLNMLAMQTSLFDPLGLACCTILPMKRLLQQLCVENYTWDEQLPEQIVEIWNQWWDQLPELQTISIPRWFRGSKYEAGKVELHVFCDASEIAMGTVAYIRVLHNDGTIHCSLVAGKSRIAPPKPVTIPRLELSAAVIGVKLGAMIQHEMTYEFERVVYWTDSTTVLQYINNVSTRFKTFVGNRLAIIMASRGVMPSKFIKCTMWFQGPEFLWKGESEWPEQPRGLAQLPLDKTEVKTAHQLFAMSGQTQDGLLTLLRRYSSIERLERAIAWLSRVTEIVRSRFGKKYRPKFHPQGLSCEEIEQARRDIYRLVQRESFPCKTKLLQKDSPLKKLSPCVVENLIVGGRLHRSNLSENARHQVILPYKHPVTDLIIERYHTEEGHCGTLHVLSALRTRFWVIKGHAAVKRVLRRCMKCKLMSAKPGRQIMAPLPSMRVNCGKKAFWVSGVDLMGLVNVKVGRSSVKRWIVVFSCLASRAVHFEVACSLDTSSFLNALERFQARRGEVSKLVSDNASNFTSANKELKAGLIRWNNSCHDNLRQKGIRWIYNPPGASHCGGCWERMIRSLRKILSTLTGDRLLNDECFYTFVTKVERILNNRPITPVGDDTKDLEALSPAMLLTGYMDADCPPDVFASADGYRKS